MRKLKLFFACLLMAVLSIGQMWGAEATIANTDNNGTCVWTDGTATITQVKWAGSTNVNNSYATNLRVYGGHVLLFDAGEGNTWKSFEYTVDTKYYGKSVSWGSSAAEITSSNYTSATAGTGSLVSTGGGSSTLGFTANRYAYIYNSATSSPVQLRITAFTATYEKSGGSTPKTLSSVTVSGTPTKTSYFAGQEFDPAGLVVTGHYSEGPDEEITSGITWSYNPAQALEGNQTSIKVKATVSEITSTDWYVVENLTVAAAPAAVNYEKVIAEPADWSGEYILVYEADATNARVWKGADQANYYAEAAISNGVIAAPDDAAVLTIAKVAESNPVVYTIMVGDKYIGQTSNANGIKIQTTAINNSISYNGTDAAVDIVASSAHLRYNSASSSYFRYYKSATYSAQKKIQLYKKVEDTVKPAAGLAYAEADQKNLIKFGETFTAPTLVNPNNLTVAYASNNTAVAEVASNGAVTIKAAGVAVITASFDGDDNYKAGSASYTIGVTTHAGTEADPYVAADAKIAIDAMGTVENAYASGIVSSIYTTSSTFDPEAGNISFYFSADGTTTGQQIEAYKCFGLNSAKFTALTDVETGATVVIKGTLKKYNSTYELDQNCYLISYEAPAAPKQSIANDQAHPYTVAQALVYAADGITYDLDDYVYVQGVVYDVKSFNNGVMNIFIKDANAENQFELYKCAGINDGNTTTPFEALTDVKEGNVVIGYGQLTVFNNVSEFKQGNYLVELQKPVTGVWISDFEAQVAEGAQHTLTAHVWPNDADNQTIDWTVESGDAYASVDENGVVTGIAEGVATIRATAHGTEFYKECAVTVTAAAPAASTDNVVILATYNNKLYAMSTNLSSGAFAAIEVVEDGANIVVTSEEDKTAIQWTKKTSGEKTTFQKADGKYLAHTGTGTNLTLQNADTENPETWTLHNDGYYYAVADRTFLYYKNGTFKNYATSNAGGDNYSGYAEVRVIAAENIVVVVPTTHEVSYNANGGTLISGETVIAPAQVAEGATVTVAANVYEKEGYLFAGWLYGETVYNAGQKFEMPTTDVELVAQWNEVVVSDYTLVTDLAQLQAGDKVIIVAANYNYAAGTQAGTYREKVEIAKTNDKSHLIFGASMPTEFVLAISENGYMFMDGSRYMYESGEKSVKTQADPFNWSVTVGEDSIATIKATNELRYNSSSPRFTTYASGQQKLQLYRKPAEYSTVRGGLAANRYYTLCFNRTMAAVQGATFWAFASKDANMAYLVQEDAPYAAGKPYIIYAEAAGDLTAVLSGEEVTTTVANGALHGTFSLMEQTALDNAGENIYLLMNNQLRRVDGQLGNSLPAYRAYIALDEIANTGAPANVPAHRVRAIPMHKDVVTGFENINATDKPVKLLIDGNIYILRGEKMYDATGRLVK